MRVITEAHVSFNPGAEKRKNARPRSFKFGTIIYARGLSRRRCIIRDVNATGARLQMNNTAGIPNHFKVVTDDDQSCYGRVMWRTNEQIGIRFVKKLTELE